MAIVSCKIVGFCKAFSRWQLVKSLVQFITKQQELVLASICLTVTDVITNHWLPTFRKKPYNIIQMTNLLHSQHNYIHFNLWYCSKLLLPAYKLPQPDSGLQYWSHLKVSGKFANHLKLQNTIRIRLNLPFYPPPQIYQSHFQTHIWVYCNSLKWMVTVRTYITCGHYSQ